MTDSKHRAASERLALLKWIAGLGAATAESRAYRDRITVGSARARLLAAARAGLLERARPLAAQPALFTLTQAGLRHAHEAGLSPCRVSNANALHLIVCAGVAAGLERCYPGHRVEGERELRRYERLRGRPLASARARTGSAGEVALHRPDLVLWPRAGVGLPVAVEVELAVKAPRRLAEICRSWARCREVEGVIYLAAAGAQRALVRAIEDTRADGRVLVLPLHALDGALGGASLPAERTIAISS